MDSKGRNIQQMFSAIAPRYDLLNHLLSVGIDISWRRKAVRALPVKQDGYFLDIATGTGDVALEILRQKSRCRVMGLDFSLPMLAVGKEKIQEKGASSQISLQYGNAEQLPFKTNSFDGITISFGLRNVSDQRRSISEMKRVVRNKGKVVILEFAVPDNPFFRTCYYFYFRYILPIIGGIVSQKKEAYTYLPESVINFPDKLTLKKMMEEEGLENVCIQVLTFGIALLHIGEVNS